MPSRKLVLVDGNAALYRAFFAIPALTTSSGRPTNAVYGFVRMIRQVLAKVAPTHIMAVFDGGISGRRRQLLETYKAQRPGMPEDLRQQIPVVEEFLQRAAIPWLRIAGEEADDILATLACKASADGGADVRILSNDKDFFQLVNDRVRIIPPTDLEKEMGSEDVVAKTGVGPAMIAEWLALCGDASDNIDGVPGVGAKTAAKLLRQFGSLNGIYDHLSEVPGTAAGRALGSSRGIVERNMQLVLLKRDLLCAPDWAAMEVGRGAPGDLVPFFKELEFNSLAAELEHQLKEETLF